MLMSRRRKYYVRGVRRRTSCGCGSKTRLLPCRNTKVFTLHPDAVQLSTLDALQLRMERQLEQLKVSMCMRSATRAHLRALQLENEAKAAKAREDSIALAQSKAEALSPAMCSSPHFLCFRSERSDVRP